MLKKLKLRINVLDASMRVFWLYSLPRTFMVWWDSQHILTAEFCPAHSSYDETASTFWLQSFAPHIQRTMRQPAHFLAILHIPTLKKIFKQFPSSRTHGIRLTNVERFWRVFERKWKNKYSLYVRTNGCYCMSLCQSLYFLPVRKVADIQWEHCSRQYQNCNKHYVGIKPGTSVALIFI